VIIFLGRHVLKGHRASIGLPAPQRGSKPLFSTARGSVL
jgi:hypothetical protein